MYIDVSAYVVQTIKISIVSLFGAFVVGAYLLALFKDRLPDRRVAKLRRLGWLAIGIAFLLIGCGVTLMILHQFGEGVASRISRDGSRVSVSFSSSPMMFLLIVGFEVFFAGFFSFIGVGYLKLFRSLREE
jgi:hypothetical protein